MFVEGYRPPLSGQKVGADGRCCNTEQESITQQNGVRAAPFTSQLSDVTSDDAVIGSDL